MRLPSDGYTTAQTAQRAGIHRDTLLRWLRERKIAEPQRDRRGWRIFSEEQVRQICSFAAIGEAASAPAIEELQSIDWHFEGAETSYLTHSIHPYPAKFIPQIPNALIQELSSVGDTVLDIFCGSGTTLVEAQLLKRHSIGIDANPIACLISRAKVARISAQEAQPLFDLISRAEAMAEDFAEPTGRLFDSSEVPLAPIYSVPHSDAIEFWFEPFVIEELSAIRSWCASLSGVRSTIARAAFSSIIVAVSKQDSDTRYVRRAKKIAPGDTFKRFSRALAKTTSASLKFTELTESRFRALVLEKDILSGPAIDSVDLLVCSPPYPNAYSYHLYHMTRMLWLEMDQPKFKVQEIGSHRKYSSPSKNGATVDTFIAEFSKILIWLRTHLNDKKYACFVVGDSTIRGQRIDNAELIADAALPLGYKEVARIERRLQATKKAFNPKIGKIKTEKVLILQRR